MPLKKLTLWSIRFSAARGNHVVAEREVSENNAHDWVAAFKKDEPGICFLVSNTKPRVK